MMIFILYIVCKNSIQKRIQNKGVIKMKSYRTIRIWPETYRILLNLKEINDKTIVYTLHEAIESHLRSMTEYRPEKETKNHFTGEQKDN